MTEKDQINPAHYKKYDVETIDMMISIWGVKDIQMFKIMNEC